MCDDDHHNDGDDREGGSGDNHAALFSDGLLVKT
jgi:hypothetical protein